MVLNTTAYSSVTREMFSIITVKRENLNCQSIAESLKKAGLKSLVSSHNIDKSNNKCYFIQETRLNKKVWNHINKSFSVNNAHLEQFDKISYNGSIASYYEPETKNDKLAHLLII